MVPCKKEIEFWRLERFKSFIPDFPDGYIEATEEPDFVIRGARVIGIELTDLHRETKPGQVPEQASEAMRKRVIARAQDIYIARQLPPVIASFFVDDRIHLKKREIEPLAESLADLVAKNLPGPNATTELPAGWEEAKQFPAILHSLSVHRLDAITKTFFNSPSATWIKNLTREDIDRALSNKDRKYSAYRARCDEAWLVINAGIESMATWFEFDGEVLTDTFTTCFDRAFLVQHFGGKAHELKLRQHGT